MRFIAKSHSSAAIAEINSFVDNQQQGREQGQPWEALPVNYDSFTRSRDVLAILIQEQKGLCAYTGAPIDDRLAEYRPKDQKPPRTDYWFSPHIEHLKPQSKCRQELEERGLVVGRDRGEDIDYFNMVGAIAVRGNSNEQFGAVVREDRPLPIVPTNSCCSYSFLYFDDGSITDNSSPAARTTIDNLKLDHETPWGWRRGAIKGYLPDGMDTPGDDLRRIIELMEDESAEELPEFCFVKWRGAIYERNYIQQPSESDH